MKIVYHHRTRATDAQRIHIQELVKAFQELGHEVEIAGLVPIETGLADARRDASDPLWKKLVRRVPLAHEAVQLGYNLVGFPMLASRVLRSRADFIYERYSLFNFAGVLAARLCRIPLVLEVNSPLALEQSRDREIRLRRLGEWAERTICNLATRVVVVTTPLLRMMENLGVRPEKLVVMTNGVRLEDFGRRAADPQLRRSLGLEGRTVAGFVGWFRKWHGLEMLLEAAVRARLAAAGVKVLLIGDGPAMPDLRAFVEKHGLHDTVVFTGPLPHAEVPRYLDLIDIAVQPAANEYCCPMKILEYMALGKAIVAPRQENILELLREGQEAEFFTPNDAASLAGALERLVRDRPRALRMGAMARRAIDDRGYLWRENARRTVELVDRARATRAAGRLAVSS